MDFSFGVGSLLGGLASSYASYKSSKAQIEAQRRENELNRQFNAQEARLAREYNTEMVNSQNTYNLPANQIQRLKDAGLNPALFYGAGASGISSVGVGGTNMQAESHGSIGTSLPDYSGLKEAMSNAVGNISAMSDSKYKEALSNLTDSQVKWYDKTKEKEFSVSDSIIFQNESAGNLNIQNRINLAKTIDQIDANIKYTESLTTGQEIQNYISSIDAFFEDKQKAAELARTINESSMFATQAQLNVTQAENIVKLFAYQAAALRARALSDESLAKKYAAETSRCYQEMYTVLPSLADNLDLEGDMLRIDLKTENARRWLGLAGDFIGSLVGSVFLGGAASRALGLGSRAVVAGFRP